MGVVYHAVYLEYFETARTELLRSHGMPYAQIEADGLMLPVLGAQLLIKRPARYDDVIDVTAFIPQVEGARLKIDYECRRDGELLVTGSTEHAFTRIDDMKPVRPPGDFIRLVRGGSGNRP
jgi:acyl-CoA thioester hydrolase